MENAQGHEPLFTTDELGDATDSQSQSAVDPDQMQGMADQLASLDDHSLAALVRGMPDETREALCSAVAATLSDQQLQTCGLSKATNMGTDDMADDLQNSMNNAKPEPLAGTSTQMSLTPTKPADPHPHSLELAQLRAETWVRDAKEVHAQNPKLITAQQLTEIEADFQGAKSLSLLSKDGNYGDLTKHTVLIETAKRLLSADADLVTNKTTNMSLTGGGTGPRAADMKRKNTGGFDAAEAKRLADETWNTKS